MNRIKTWPNWLARIVLLVVLLNLCGVVSFVYRNPVENEVLHDPVAVVAVENHRIELADGRAIKINAGESEQQLWKLIQEAGGWIDVDVDHGSAALYTRNTRFVCGLGMPIYIIPLIPQNVPRYDRRLMIIGEIEKDAAE